MLYQNMKVGMKVAVRSGMIGIGDEPNEKHKSNKLSEEPYYILRMPIREDEIRNANGKVENYCVINKNIKRLEEGASKEGQYGHCDLMEPYDLVIEKQNNETKGR